jgi:hypothetical protein
MATLLHGAVQMSLVVLLKGLNVGGHRTFRPRELARQLQPLEVTNIGAAGTFVVHHPIGRTQLRDEITRKLPFAAEIVICDALEFLRLRRHAFFVSHPVRPDIVRFVSVLARLPRGRRPTSIRLPPDGRWLLKVVAREGRFVLGMYRRDMKVIGYLRRLDDLFGVPATTRNWTTVSAICSVLERS